MTEEQFIERVKQAEKEVNENKTSYHNKLLLFALLGYLAIFLILFAVVALIGGSVWFAFLSTTFAVLLLKKKLIIPLCVLAWVLVKALWVKFDKPTGYQLKREEFPELYKEIDQLREKLDALPIHQVLLNYDLNASVVQTPRLGVFGWQYNTLTLGLELLLMLSPEEMRAVLAHEFGHLSKNHSRFAGWIYRVRITWQKVMDAFGHADGFGPGILRRFFNWYVPRFSAYSFALARNNEYEADAISAELTSPAIASRALVNVHVAAPYVEEHYWDKFFKKADVAPQPEGPPYEGLSQFLVNNSQAKEEIKEGLKKELEQKTAYHNTHPALADRLKAMGEKKISFKTFDQSAAQVWLGKNYRKILQEFDSDWKEMNEERWRERYEYVLESNKKLNELEEKDNASLSDDELWEKARLTREFKQEKDSLPLFQEYYQRHPQDAAVNYVIGDILAQKKDEACLKYLSEATNDASIKVQACELAYCYLKDAQKEDEAQVWYDRAVKAMEINQAADDERLECTPKDEYKKSTIPEELKKELIEKLKNYPKLGSAWIAEKVLKHFPNHPVYIVAFKTKRWNFSWDKIMEEVVEHIQLEADLFLVVKGGDYTRLAKKVIKAGEQIV